MQNLYYSMVGFLAIIIHIVINKDIIFNRESDAKGYKTYRRFVLSVLIFFCIDIGWGVFGEFGLMKLLYIDTVLFHVAMATTIVLWNNYVIAYLDEGNKARQVISTIGILFLLFEVTALFINLIYPVFFWIDAEGNYKAGPIRYIALIVQISIFALVMVRIVIKLIKLKKMNNSNNKSICKRNITIGFFSLSMIFALSFQLAYPLLPIYSMGYLVGCTVLYAFIVEDQKRELYELLEKEKNSAEQSSRVKTEFLFSMSHDIRTPMNAILGYSSLLRKHLDDKEKREEYLNNIQASGEYLLHIINNVLETARIENGMNQINETAGNCQEHASQIAAIFMPEAAAKNINLTISTEVKHNYVYHDVTKIEQIMLNVISNAIKYTPNNGNVAIQLKELPSDNEGYVIHQTTVSDNGIGISKEFLPHIFENFSREKTVTENKINGTGLGLGIVKQLVGVLEGTIDIESEQGKGTTVTIKYPQRIASESDVVSENRNKIDYSVIKGKRILMAEDNELNADITATLLSEVGLIVDHAHDGIECIEMLNDKEAGYYEMILMDVQMPNMDGLTATREIRKLADANKNNIPIIAMTANAFEADKRKSLEAGMNDFIPKPIVVDDMMEIIFRNSGVQQCSEYD